MAIHLTAVCEAHHEPGTRKVQPLRFDDLHETFGDVVAMLRDAGWLLELDGATVTRCLCPTHAKAAR